jgi:solute carrier family 35, member C2
MFKDENGQEKIVFPFPLFTTCVHMIVQFSLASLVLLALPRLRPRHGPIHLAAHGEGYSEETAEKGPLMTKWFYLSRIGPCGAATGLDIGLGNMSLKFISLTFYSKIFPLSHQSTHWQH